MEHRWLALLRDIEQANSSRHHPTGDQVAFANALQITFEQSVQQMPLASFEEVCSMSVPYEAKPRTACSSCGWISPISNWTAPPSGPLRRTGAIRTFRITCPAANLMYAPAGASSSTSSSPSPPYVKQLQDFNFSLQP